MRRGVQLASALLSLAVMRAQERANEAEIGFEQYYLTNGATRISNVSGLSLDYHRTMPGVGVLSISLAPAASAGRFQTGETFIELKGLPWMGNYWTFRGGDFRVRGHVLDVPFTNLYDPEITGRGTFIEATHGGRTVGFLYGAETLQAGVRVPLRLIAPQTIGGGYIHQKLGERLLLGARLLQLSTDLQELRRTPYLSPRSTLMPRATTAVIDGLYTIAGPLKWYAEAGLSTSTHEGVSPVHSKPYSATAGPLIETDRFTFKANYLYQSDSYLPLLGYYLGDRSGPYGEFKIRPFDRLDLYASISDYRNNVARDPQQATIHSVASSAGASLRLPARFSFSGQWSDIKLATRATNADPWDDATSKQVQLTLARPIGRHNLRFTGRDFQQFTRFGIERQLTEEAEDSFQVKWLTLGAAVRLQRMTGRESKSSIYVRGNGQINLKRVSAYANIESGNDLANRTLFATSTVSSTVFGGSLNFGGGWNLQAEAFRNNLLAELNPESIFVLQGQGVFVPTVLSMFNQWSFYLRMTKQFSWGNPVPVNTNATGGFMGPGSLKGSVEGFVTSARNRPVEGVPVTLDGGEPVFTGAQGRFVFEDVAEGARKVGLAMDQLPAEFNPGNTTEVTALVRPGKRNRVVLNVVALGAIRGVISAPDGLTMQDIVIKLLPSQRYTTPDATGAFGFYNLPEGEYSVELVPSTLPPSTVLADAAPIPVSVEAGKEPSTIRFVLEVHAEQKPVRQIILESR